MSTGSIPFYADLDLNYNQLVRARFVNSATAPTTPQAGQIYFNSSDLNFYGWSAASNLLWRFLGQANTLRTAAGTTVGHAIWFRRNSVPDANELGGTAFASGAYRYYEVIGTYVAA